MSHLRWMRVQEWLFLRMPQLFKHIISDRIRPTIQQLQYNSILPGKYRCYELENLLTNRVWYSAPEISSGFHRATFPMNEKFWSRKGGAGRVSGEGRDCVLLFSESCEEGQWKSGWPLRLASECWHSVMSSWLSRRVCSGDWYCTVIWRKGIYD